MALVVLLFLSILLATFGLVIAMTRPSPQEKTIEQRMALIHLSQKNQAGTAPESAQLFKAAKIGRFGWLDEILEPYSFVQTIEKRILPQLLSNPDVKKAAGDRTIKIAPDPKIEIVSPSELKKVREGFTPKK